MKRGTATHPKVACLASILKIEKVTAIGLLELLWHFTAQYTPAGNVGKYGNQAIAEGCLWSGDAEALIDALVSAGWLDLSDEHRLVVHDWGAHADDATHAAVARARARFVCGMAPKLSRLNSDERTQLKGFYEDAPPDSALATPRSRRGDAQGPPRRANSAKPSQASPIQSLPSPAPEAQRESADGAGEDSRGGAACLPGDARAELKRAGVGAPAIDLLAAAPGITGEIVAEEAEEARRGKPRDPTAVLVARLCQRFKVSIGKADRQSIGVAANAKLHGVRRDHQRQIAGAAP